MVEIGRKAWITTYGLSMSAVATGYAMWATRTVPDGFFGAVATMVLAFCGGNAATTFASSLTTNRTVSEQVKREIQDRRSQSDDGTEPSP